MQQPIRVVETLYFKGGSLRKGIVCDGKSSI